MPAHMAQKTQGNHCFFDLVLSTLICQSKLRDKGLSVDYRLSIEILLQINYKTQRHCTLAKVGKGFLVLSVVSYFVWDLLKVALSQTFQGDV